MTDAEKLISIARKELGTKEPTGDDKYLKWYNKVTGYTVPMNTPWCAVFVSWCMCKVFKQFKPFASCTWMMTELRNQGRIATRRENAMKVKPGQLVFYDWDGSGDCDHVGIVESIKYGTTLHVIEGNYSDSVKIRTIASDDVRICYYGLLPKSAYIDYDVNGDGEVNANDAKEILQQAVGKKAKTKKADVNDDGKVDANDAKTVLKKAVGK